MVFEIQSPALAMGVLLLAGYLGGRVTRMLRLPAVAGYVIAGVILGPSVLKAIPSSLNQSLTPLKDFGVGMVAMAIGSELVWKKLRRLGLSIFIISVLEAAAAFVFVFLALRYLLGQPFVVATMLASLATVTTPVATFAVIREYRAKGPFTSTLLGVVAADDIWCITAASISVGLVLSMGTGTNTLKLVYLLPALWDVISSIGLGIIEGIVAVLILQYIYDELEILAFVVGVVFLNAAVGRYLDKNAILITMSAGIIISNFYRDDVLKVINRIDIPVLIAFFTLAGAGLHLDSLFANWIIVITYIVFRIIGKISGCYFGALVSKADEKVRRYLGPAMLTKAGLSLGLLIYMQERLRGMEISALLSSAELAAITFFEMTGPICVRWALFKAGEARMPEKSRTMASAPQPAAENA